jgi:uncharacterized protein YecT (DUF1311 family)
VQTYFALKKPLVFFAAFSFAFAASAANTEPAFEKTRKRLEVADVSLNKAYKSLCSELDKEKLAELRKQQRAWLEYRDFRSESMLRFNGIKADNPKTTVVYWETMADLTEERTEFLHIYTGKNAPKEITGEYGDCYSGDLQLEETKNGIVFSIVVVRGASAHTGEISEIARYEGDKAFYKEQHVEPNENRAPCELTFTFIDKHIVKIEGKNTEYYHGFGAYFDGLYFKIAKLKEPIKLEH